MPSPTEPGRYWGSVDGGPMKVLEVTNVEDGLIVLSSRSRGLDAQSITWGPKVESGPAPDRAGWWYGTLLEVDPLLEGIRPIQVTEQMGVMMAKAAGSWKSRPVNEGFHWAGPVPDVRVGYAAGELARRVEAYDRGMLRLTGDRRATLQTNWTPELEALSDAVRDAADSLFLVIRGTYTLEEGGGDGSEEAPD